MKTVSAQRVATSSKRGGPWAAERRAAYSEMLSLTQKLKAAKKKVAETTKAAKQAAAKKKASVAKAVSTRQNNRDAAKLAMKIAILRLDARKKEQTTRVTKQFDSLGSTISGSESKTRTRAQKTVNRFK